MPTGITKIIINSKAAEKEASPALKSFLQYMNGKASNDEFIQKVERRIKEVKQSEELRREYMLINSFERDARNEGWKAGIAQGRTEGIAQGSYQAKLETAMAFKRLGFDIAKIAEGTGLSREEIEAL
ncbi:Rpn family recombination-promoting nuclease/putative transposase [Treponema putidum]|uniref:Rpn family recombination-promoting nuclease/putative transposase n=1 Tax=Treponema putidum TaxID=221027 RepID=UPI0034E298AC